MSEVRDVSSTVRDYVYVRYFTDEKFIFMNVNVIAKI